MRYLHTMVRIKNIEESLDFYCNHFGMKEFNRIENAVGSGVTSGFGINKSRDQISAYLVCFSNKTITQGKRKIYIQTAIRIRKRVLMHP